MHVTGRVVDAATAVALVGVEVYVVQVTPDGFPIDTLAADVTDSDGHYEIRSYDVCQASASHAVTARHPYGYADPGTGRAEPWPSLVTCSEREQTVDIGFDPLPVAPDRYVRLEIGNAWEYDLWSAVPSTCSVTRSGYLRETVARDTLVGGLAALLVQSEFFDADYAPTEVRTAAVRFDSSRALVFEWQGDVDAARPWRRHWTMPDFCPGLDALAGHTNCFDPTSVDIEEDWQGEIGGVGAEGVRWQSTLNLGGGMVHQFVSDIGLTSVDTRFECSGGITRRLRAARVGGQEVGISALQ